MQLDAVLVDVARDLCPLRFVLLQLMLEIRNKERVCGRVIYFGRGRHASFVRAVVAAERNAGGGSVDDIRRSAVTAGENDVRARLSGGYGGLHYLWT